MNISESIAYKIHHNSVYTCLFSVTLSFQNAITHIRIIISDQDIQDFVVCHFWNILEISSIQIWRILVAITYYSKTKTIFAKPPVITFPLSDSDHLKFILYGFRYCIIICSSSVRFVSNFVHMIDFNFRISLATVYFRR